MYSKARPEKFYRIEKRRLLLQGKTHKAGKRTGTNCKILYKIITELNFKHKKADYI
jgi:hypothetical protein